MMSFGAKKAPFCNIILMICNVYRHKKSFAYLSYVKTIFLLTIEKNNHILQEWNTLIEREALPHLE